MPTIIYREANVKIKKSIIISPDKSSSLTTSTDDSSDSISLELGVITTTANNDSLKVKESNTMSSNT